MTGSSVLQEDSKKYYGELRDLHSKTFSEDPDRIEAEKTEKRYVDGNIEEIENLFTFINWLVQLIPNKKDVKGVDIGCGSHNFVDQMRREKGWDVRGFDPDAKAIKKAQIYFPESRGSYSIADVLAGIPLPDNSQDFVFSNAVIQHFDDSEIRSLLQEVRRILKKDGIFLVIFKRNIPDWDQFAQDSGSKVELLDVM